MIQIKTLKFSGLDITEQIIDDNVNAFFTNKIELIDIKTDITSNADGFKVYIVMIIYKEII